METEEDQLVQALPRERNWDGTSYIFQYQGFWFPSWGIHGVISFQRRFQARATDLFLASFPKCGTTWLKSLIFTIVNRARYGLNDTPLLITSPHDLVPFLDLDLFSNKNQIPDLEHHPNLKKLAEFLGCPFSADEERDGVMEQVSRLCSFENLKSLEVNNTGKRKSGSPNSAFFRKGKVGDWANYLTPSMAQRLNNLVEEKLAGSGLSFKAS